MDADIWHCRCPTKKFQCPTLGTALAGAHLAPAGLAVFGWPSGMMIGWSNGESNENVVTNLVAWKNLLQIFRLLESVGCFWVFLADCFFFFAHLPGEVAVAVVAVVDDVVVVVVVAVAVVAVVGCYCGVGSCYRWSKVGQILTNLQQPDLGKEKQTALQLDAFWFSRSIFATIWWFRYSVVPTSLLDPLFDLV